MNWFLTLPDPGETAGTPRRPFQKYDGVYYFSREPLDTEVVMWEPNGDSYLLEFFELGTFLRSIWKLPEEGCNRILDYLWNFFRIAYHTQTERIIILRTVDQEGWEDEVKLAWGPLPIETQD